MARDEVDELSLLTLMGGLAVERFDDELTKVLENIIDPNTKPDATRSITLKVTMKPNKNRGLSDMILEVGSKIANPDKASTTVFIAMTKTGPVATEHNPNQPSLPLEPAATVTPLRSMAGGA